MCLLIVIDMNLLELDMTAQDGNNKVVFTKMLS